MTDDDLHRLRLAADATALRAIALWAADRLREVLPPADPGRAQVLMAIEKKLSQARSDYMLMTFPEMEPAMSDLWAGEAQEAFDRASAEFLQRLTPTL